MKLNSETFTLSEAGSFGSKAMIVGGVGLLGTAVGYFTVDSGQFFHSYLTAFIFWTTLGLGALFFTLLHHLVDAEWSVALRRLAESVASVLPLMVVFFIPIAFGAHDLFHWTHEEAVASDPILQSKAPYLSMNFFYIRAAFYFGIWFLLSRKLYGMSMSQDAGDDSVELNVRMRRFSAPGMVLFALTLTFAAFDWMMSLNPHWYSTIFGVYTFVGSFLCALSFFTLILMMMRKQGVLADKITTEHYHDLGKLLFAFTVFWAYIAFSQYFLIWYGNIPEETVFYHTRWKDGWKPVTMLLVLGHFAGPFLALIPRGAKRNLTWLKVMAIWMFFIHWVDVYWLIMPNFGHEGVMHGFHFSWIDLAPMLGIGGIFIWLFWNKFTSKPIVPVKDRKLEASFNFINS